MAKFKLEDVIEILKDEYNITPKKDPDEDEDDIELEYETKIKKELPKTDKPKLSEKQIERIRELARSKF